jgi:hypothetical protein
VQVHKPDDSEAAQLKKGEMKKVSGNLQNFRLSLKQKRVELFLRSLRCMACLCKLNSCYVLYLDEWIGVAHSRDELGYEGLEFALQIRRLDGVPQDIRK